jgi:hypothetical protein
MTVSLLFFSSNAIVFIRSSTFIFARQSSLSNDLWRKLRKASLQTHSVSQRRTDLPRLLVLAVGVVFRVSLAEPVLLQLDALLDGRFDLEQVDRGAVRGARKDVELRVKHDVCDCGVSTPATERLEGLAPISAEDLDNCALLGGRSDQSPLWVDAEGAQL